MFDHKISSTNHQYRRYHLYFPIYACRLKDLKIMKIVCTVGEKSSMYMNSNHKLRSGNLYYEN